MKRNGKIELMRFLFSVSVFLFHVNMTLWNHERTLGEHLSFFRHGNMGVEFFFLVSGFLMAKSVARRNRQLGLSQDWEALSGETVRFVWGKVKGLLPYHLPFCALMIALVLKIKPGKWDLLIGKLPSLFFFNRTGLMGKSSSLLGVEWYISSMLLALFILYPLCRRYGRFFSRVIAPVGAMLILGYMCYNVGRLSDGSLWNGITFHCNLRALAELGLGCTCYEVSDALQHQTLRLWQRALLSLLEGVSYLLCFYFICSFADFRYESYVLMCLCVAVTLSFAQQGLLSKTILFQNPLWVILGGMSLPIYLIQPLFLDGIPALCADLPLGQQAKLMILLTLGCGAAAYVIVTLVSALLLMRKNH